MKITMSGTGWERTLTTTEQIKCKTCAKQLKDFDTVYLCPSKNIYCEEHHMELYGGQCKYQYGKQEHMHERGSLRIKNETG